MQTVTPMVLSGSTNGLPIPVAATATPGTLIHTAVASVTGMEVDEVSLTVANVTGSSALLTIEWGGVSDPASLATKQLSIPANSPQVDIIVAHRLRAGLVIRAFSGTANALNIMGSVNRFQ